MQFHFGYQQPLPVNAVSVDVIRHFVAGWKATLVIPGQSRRMRAILTLPVVFLYTREARNHLVPPNHEKT
jgi:hypothetical protein